MPGRTAAGAVDAFEEPLRRCAADVFGPTAHCQSRGDQALGVRRTLTFNNAEPLALGGTRGRFGLIATISYHLIEDDNNGPYRCTTDAYSYDVLMRSEVGDWVDVLAFHWHPSSRSHVEAPHVHLEAGLGALEAPFQKLHLPTSRVTFEDVLEMLVVDLGCRAHSAKWLDTVGKTRAKHVEHRSWSVWQP